MKFPIILALLATLAIADGDTLNTPNPIKVGGYFQLNAHYYDILPENSQIESSGFSLKRLNADLTISALNNLTFISALRLSDLSEGQALKLAFLAWSPYPAMHIYAGLQKKPVSREWLTGSQDLWTIDRTSLYHSFLRQTNGYLGYDLGVSAIAALPDSAAVLRFGIFNGPGSQDRYNDPNLTGRPGIRSRDIAASITLNPLRYLSAEAGLSLKTADDENARHLELAMDWAYQLGIYMEYKAYALQAEAALGDNHNGADSLIIKGHKDFFSCYVMARYRQRVKRYNYLELIGRWETLDPAVSSKLRDRNDAVLKYTAGLNYIFRAGNTLRIASTVLQPVTEIKNDKHLTHGVEVMWQTVWGPP